MNQENWDALTQKLAESEQLQTQIDELQATLSQLRTEIEDLAGTIQEELAELRTTTSEPDAA